MTASRAYNDFGELTSRQVLVGDTDTYTASYSRDALGRIETRSETTGGVTVENTYHYDEAGRLIQVDENGVTTYSYSYDGNGNRIEHTGPAGTVDAEYDEQDRMTRYGDSFYTYNEAGDLTDKSGPEGVAAYGYDAAGNLRTVTLPDGTEIEYLIDGRDRRVGKKVDSVLEKTWIYRDNLNPVAQFDGDGNMTHRFVYAEKFHVPSYMVKIDPATGEETDYRIVSDHLGSVRLVVEVDTGALVQELEYGPFGQVLYDGNPGFQPFGFAGGLYDRDTGLVRFGARDYDPVTGRWTAKDPIDFSGGDSNLYGYISADPVNSIDPFGLQSLSDFYGNEPKPWENNSPANPQCDNTCQRVKVIKSFTDRDSANSANRDIAVASGAGCLALGACTSAVTGGLPLATQLAMQTTVGGSCLGFSVYSTPQIFPGDQLEIEYDVCCVSGEDMPDIRNVTTRHLRSTP